MTDDYKYGPWMIWNGDGPTPTDKPVQAQLRCDTRMDAEMRLPSTVWGWVHYGSDYDIIAYREVIEPKRETVVRYAEFHRRNGTIYCMSPHKYPDDNLRLHIPLVDGEIEDGALIRVERLR